MKEQVPIYFVQKEKDEQSLKLSSVIVTGKIKLKILKGVSCEKSANDPTKLG